MKQMKKRPVQRSHERPTDTIQYRLHVPPRELAPVSMILDGYEGVCLVTSAHEASGILQVLAPPGQEAELRRIVEDISLVSGRIRLERLDPTEEA